MRELAFIPFLGVPTDASTENFDKSGSFAEHLYLRPNLSYNCVMLGVKILSGGVGSGKTREIVSRLAALYRVDPFRNVLVLTPTVRHADQLRSRLLQECSVAMNLRVETLSMASREFASGRAILSRSRATDQLAHVARRSVGHGGAASYFSPIANSPGFVSMIGAAVESLLEELVEADALTEAATRSSSEVASALAEIYAAYIAELNENGLTHPLHVSLAAAEAIQAGEPVPDVVMFDGFQRFTSGELRLIAALAQRADMTLCFDPSATVRSEFDFQRLRDALPTASVTELVAADRPVPLDMVKREVANREQHAREIARQIKRLMAEDLTLRPSDCAVTFRQVAPYLSLMRRIFDEYEIPLDAAAGLRLSDTPVGVWIRRLLGIAQNGWRIRDVVAVLRSGIVNLDLWGISTDFLGAFSEQARQQRIWAGRERLEGLAGSMTAADGARVSVALREIGDLLDGLESYPTGREQRLADALFGERGWLRRDHRISEETERQIEELRQYVSELAADARHSDGEGAYSYEGFLERLRRRLDMPVLRHWTAGGVVLAPMHTMHGLRFRHVMVGGLSEGEFPASRRSGELLNDTLRDSLQAAGLLIPPASRASEDELWQSAISRANESTSLWRYRITDDGKPVPAAWVFEMGQGDIAATPELSPTLDAASGRELAIACTRSWLDGVALRPPVAARPEDESWATVRVAAGVEQVRRSFRFAGAYEGQVSSGLVPWRTGEGAKWSASSLDSYLTCSFQFYGKYVLRLAELDDEQTEGDAAIRGTIIHEILEQAFEPLARQGLPLSTETIHRVLNHIDTNGRERWMRAPETEGFGQAALWRLEWERYRDRLKAMLERQALEAERSGSYRVADTEYEFNETVPTDPPLQVVGKIDRIDLWPHRIVVIDYKTGAIPSKSQVREGKAAQLPLYAYAVRGHPDAQGKDVRMEYAKLPSRRDTRPWALDESIEEDAEVISGVISTLQGKRDLVEAGDFRVNPQVADCPQYCVMKHVCRVNAFSRHKS